MYKKIIFTKSATQNMNQMNDLAREEIKKFLALNGWVLQEGLSNACNYCLTKDFSTQEDSLSNELNYKVFPFKSHELFYNSSTKTWGGVEVNGTFHLSISKPLHNSRVLSVTPGENPWTNWSSADNYYKNYTTSQGYNATDAEITKLCTQDPDGYQDSGVRYPMNGFQKNRILLELFLRKYIWRKSVCFYLVFQTDEFTVKGTLLHWGKRSNSRISIDVGAVADFIGKHRTDTGNTAIDCFLHRNWFDKQCIFHPFNR